MRSSAVPRLWTIKRLHILGIVLAGLIFTLPALIWGMPLLSDDGVTHHAVWYINFSEQLWSGDLYPRWLINMNSGLGSPVFFYYPPVPYFITSVLKPMFADDPYGRHQLGVSAFLALAASGLTAYFWLKKISGDTSAFIAAILYMLMPYHLAADFYVRGAFAEYWAFVWIPLILFFTHKIALGHRASAIGLGIAYALLIMTHLPTTLIFSLIPICYVLVMSERVSRGNALLVTVCGMALGVGLSAIYLLPALLTQQAVFLDKMSTGYFSYKHWLLFSPYSMWIQDRPEMILLVIDMAAVACCSFIIAQAHKLFNKFATFWLCAAVVSIFMMTEFSRPVWTVSSLQKIQFSWRFNVILSLASAALLASAVASIRKVWSIKIALAFTAGLLCIVAWIPATGRVAWLAFPQTNPDRKAIESRNEIVSQSRDVPEYRPRSSESMAEIDWNLSTDADRWDTLLSEEYTSLLQRAGKSGGSATKFEVVSGSGDANIDLWKPRNIVLHVLTPTGLTLNVLQFYYPGWTAHAIGEELDLKIMPSQPDGLINFSVPGGDHHILLALEPSPSESTGKIISFASVMVAISLVLTSMGRSRLRNS